MSLLWLHYNHVATVARMDTLQPYRYRGYSGYTLTMSIQWLHYNHDATVVTVYTL